MTYRPISMRVENDKGISVDVKVDPENFVSGTEFFIIEQDDEAIVVTLDCLENLVLAAKELITKGNT